jgi:hypothetical protein
MVVMEAIDKIWEQPFEGEKSQFGVSIIHIHHLADSQQV